MIFRPLVGQGLANVVRDLGDWLYLTPRFELPEICWETLDRLDPMLAIQQVSRWGSTLWLDQLIRCEEPILFDGPGDFQLLPRSMAFALDGFDESIVEGWHVDGNLCARAALLKGMNKPLHQRVYGYHCDHNRTATYTHTSASKSGNLETLIFGIKAPDIPKQRNTWGSPTETFEEISLIKQQPTWRILETMIQARETPSSQDLVDGTYNLGTSPSLSLVLPHLVSHLSTRGSQLKIGYLGFHSDLLTQLKIWGAQTNRELEFFTAPSCLPLLKDQVTSRSIWELLENLDVVIIDAHLGPDAALLRADENPADRQDKYGIMVRDLATAAVELARLCRLLQVNGPRILALNAQHSWLESLLMEHFNLTLTPFASRVRPALLLSVKPELRTKPKSNLLRGLFGKR